MLNQTVILLFFGAVLLATNLFLFWYSYKAGKKIDILLEKGKIKDFKDIFLFQKKKHEELEEKVKEAFLKISKLEDISKTTIQKTSVVRFNPFNEMGGNQSFVIALLDNKNNGFVISSLFTNEGNRVYTKAIKDGKSNYKLSKEEKEAVDKAIKL